MKLYFQMEKNIIRNEKIIFEFCSGNYGDNYFFRKTENNGR